MLAVPIIGRDLRSILVNVLSGSREETVDLHQSGVSRHLRILHEAGFVQVRPDGPRRLYSLRAGPFRELDTWVAQYRALWEARLDRFAAELDRRQKARRKEKTT